MNNRDNELKEIIDQQVEQIEQTKEELEEYKDRLEEHSRDTDMLKRLYDDGFIDLNGNPIIKN